MDFIVTCLRFVELDNKATLSDHILTAVLGLLKKEVPEHGRHLQQYFHFFLMYSTIGPPEVCIQCSTGVALCTHLTPNSDKNHKFHFVKY